MANEDYSIRFGSQQLLIENPPDSGIFGAPCGITTLGKSMTANTSDVDLPPCDDPDAVTWLGIDPVSKRLTLTFSGTLAQETLPIWDAWSMSEGIDDAFRLVRWYRNIGAPNQGYWEGKALLTEYAENSENRGRWTVSGTIVFDGRPEWHSIPPAPGVTTPVSIPTTAPEVGSAFAATPGTYTGTPDLTYQWFADDIAIDGATTVSYSPIAGDMGKVLHVVETATNVSGSINTKSADSLPVVTP
ncbi:phage tail tube protein [Nitratireductor sp. GCM10026969]|uniref:phage tail tube protein n=1 Tax=Nitratireductor sp. GCM10026969 TaxID=3252645 RepID=UPI003607C50D